MLGFIEGVGRDQVTLFPEQLEDWIGEDHPVRVVDVFVDALNLAEIGFDRAAPAPTGRPGYHPSVLLKLFIYGYLNRIASSRRLEREAGRNIEVMWLTGRLVPDHKTIADFRRDNSAAIRKTCARFVELCRRMGVLNGASVAIDGSKFKAVNNRDRNFTAAKIKLRISHLEDSAARYLEEMARTDRKEQSEIQLTKIERLKEKLARVHEEVKRLESVATKLKDTPDGQISVTDPDARSMATRGKGTGLVGYNVQTAVDMVNISGLNNGEFLIQLSNACLYEVPKRTRGIHDFVVISAYRFRFTNVIAVCCLENEPTPLLGSGVGVFFNWHHPRL